MYRFVDPPKLKSNARRVHPVRRIDNDLYTVHRHRPLHGIDHDLFDFVLLSLSLDRSILDLYILTERCLIVPLVPHSQSIVGILAHHGTTRLV